MCKYKRTEAPVLVPIEYKLMKELGMDRSGVHKHGEGGSRLRPKWDGMTQHGKDFPNRVGNTTTNTTTQRMSLMWSRPTHEGKCPGRFQITDDFRQAQKRQSTE